MSKSAICIAPNEASASRIVDALKQSGFPDDRISALFPDKSTSRDFAHEKHTKAPEGATAGAGAGGAVGGGVGLLAGLGLLAVPGVGPFLAAGPIMAALGGAAVGATVGGIGGALIGMGIPEIEAKRYEGKIKDGNILIAVHAKDSDEVDRAKDIFEHHDAEDISVVSESDVPSDQESNREHQVTGERQVAGERQTIRERPMSTRERQATGEQMPGERHPPTPTTGSPDRTR